MLSCSPRRPFWIGSVSVVVLGSADQTSTPDTTPNRTRWIRAGIAGLAVTSAAGLLSACGAGSFMVGRSPDLYVRPGEPALPGELAP
jgi:hypothetical protein